MSSTHTKASEYGVIASLLQQYINAARSGKGEDMKSVFHDGASIFGYVGNEMFADPIQQFFAWNENNGPATELEGWVASIDLVDTVATARLELDNWTGHRFTDLFTLLKVDGEWKIMNKVFHLHTKQPAEGR